MSLFQHRPSYMRYLQIIKEHVHIRRLIRNINIQIPILRYRKIRKLVHI